jgi:hypothetical protein
MTSRLESIARAIPLVSAIVYVAFFAVAMVILRPNFLWEPGDIGDFFDSYGRVIAGSWIGALSVVGLIWFLGSLGESLRAIGERRLGTIAFAGGVAGAAVTVAGLVAFSMGTLRVDDAGGLRALGASSGIGPGYTVGIFDLAMILIFAAAPFMFGVTVSATAIGNAKAGVARPWETWVGVLLAVALWIPPISWMAIWFFLIWVLWVGWKMRTAPRAGIALDTSEPDAFSRARAHPGD